MSASVCDCPRACETTSYSLESVTQAVKSPLFFRLSELPRAMESNRSASHRDTLTLLKDRYLTEAQVGNHIIYLHTKC
ncbi:hypothetical protein Ciccas_001319 [Cichlidogyrus casuarinus]|uniref:Uncharacterized protein n=1 Tax=Cichlidogyrus casuarinus TaxID=1844966 RepID=A0ABD2QKV7_9PLAT